MKQYDELEQLNRLRQNGALTEEEYQWEKEKILNQNGYSDNMVGGMEVNTYCMLLHLSQFCGYLIPLAGLAVPIVLWALHNDTNKIVDKHGKIVINWMISLAIYMMASITLCFCVIGIPFVVALVICHFIFVIIGAVKANAGEFWTYPLSIRFLYVD